MAAGHPIDRRLLLGLGVPVLLGAAWGGQATGVLGAASAAPPPVDLAARLRRRAAAGPGRARPTHLGDAWHDVLADHRQLLVARGATTASVKAVVEAWGRSGGRWYRLARWSGHSGSKGWGKTARGDGRSPRGLFTLTSAGGHAKDPGTSLPYDHRPAVYQLERDGVRTFKYVVAIDYNHVAGTTPMSPVYPEGAAKGGHIWLHVDHRSATAGCVTIPARGLVSVLRWLDADASPAIVMGDHAYLAHPS